MRATWMAHLILHLIILIILDEKSQSTKFLTIYFSFHLSATFLDSNKGKIVHVPNEDV
jgi:hypothetical protein